MSKRNPEAALRQTLTHAREAVEICQRRSRSDLDSDRLLNLALSRLIEMIGAAADRVPDSVQARYPDLPWLQMGAARNRLITGYDGIDADILWAIVTNDLPGVIHQLEEILRALSPRETIGD